MISIRQAQRQGRLAPSTIWPNVVAGLVVASVALPLSMAYAIGSGVPPQWGLYSTIILTFVGSLIGGSVVLISAPASALITLVGGLSGKDGLEAVVVTAIIAGVLLVIMGLVKFGRVMQFIPEPVILGFMLGVSFTIAFGAVVDVLGVPKPKGHHYHEKIADLGRHITQVHVPTMILGFSLVLLMIVVQNVKPLKRLPGPLVALVAGWLVVRFLHPEGVATVGTKFGGIPSGLPTPSIPDVSVSLVLHLLLPGFVIAFIAAIEALLASKVGDGLAGTRHHSNQELKSQGIGNILCGLFGSMPGTGSVSRTATSIKNGGSSPVAGLTLVVALILVLLLLAPLAVDIPMAAIGAILLMVAWKMAEVPHLIGMSKRSPRSDIVILWLTALLTIFTGLEVAAPVGVMLASLYFMSRMAKSVSYSTKGDGELLDEDGDGAGETEVPAGTLVFDIDGPFFFAAIEPFEMAMDELAADPQNLIIRLDDAPYMDLSGLEAMEDAIERLHDRGVRVIICDANDRIRVKLEKVGIVDLIGEQNMPNSFEEALALVRAA